MAAFRGAVEVGAHAIETDVHLTGDGVAVLSHDASVSRCFGVRKAIRDCTWEYLSTLETLREPRQGLPRLQDLLSWIVGEQDKSVQNKAQGDRPWVLLDIKLDDDPRELLQAISKAISNVPSPVPWENRIVLGCWNASVLQASRTILPSFPVAHIGLSLSYARHFLPIHNISLNMAFHTLFLPVYGRRFMRDLVDLDRSLFAWTVNHPRWMKWCIRQNVPRSSSSQPSHKSVKVIDGVVTDDPKLYLDVCREYEDQLDGLVGQAGRSSLEEIVRLIIGIVKSNVRATLFFWYRRHVERKLDDLDMQRLKKE